jgi:outer membrane protein TolC
MILFMKFRWLIAGLFLFLMSQVQGQEVIGFSLQEARAYAMENNFDIKMADTDIEIARKRVKESISTGLPQVSGMINYTNNIELPTQLIPGEFFGLEEGEFAELQFGTRHNANWSAGVNQMIFNGQFLVGLQASQAFLKLREASRKKTLIDVNSAIDQPYYTVVILSESKMLFDSTLQSLENMLYETEEYYKAGFLEDTDVDQLEIVISSMQATLMNIENQLEIAYNTLKYQMGITEETKIEVTDKSKDLISELEKNMLSSSEFFYERHIDYQILQRQKQLSLLNVDLQKSEHYPMINAFYSYGQNAMRNSFNFFDNNEKWFTSQMVGIQMDVPIFSSGYRHHKVQQAKLEFEKVRIAEDQLKQGLALRFSAVNAEFLNGYRVYQNKKLSSQNAQNIFQKTEIKYLQGISSSLELSQTYNQFLSAQIEYLTSMLELMILNSELEKELARGDL